MREKIASLVRAIEPHDPREAADQDWTLAWIASGAPLFRIKKPDQPDKHLVCYCVVFDVDRRKVLLGNHRIAGRLLPSGGHVEPDEDPDLGAPRELHEELGISVPQLFQGPLFITVTKTVGAVAGGHFDVSLWYVFRGDTSSAIGHDSGEFDGVDWFALDAIPFARCDPEMRRFTDKLQDKLRLLA